MSFVTDYMLSLLVASLVILIYLLIKKQLEFFSSRNIPYVKPTFMGALTSISMNSFINRPQELYVQERDKDNLFVGFFLNFLSPFLLVLDPNIIGKILIKDFQHFQDHGITLDTDHDFMIKNLFNLRGDTWRTLRIKLLPTFTSGKLKGMLPTMDNCAQILINGLKQDEKSRKDIDLKELFKEYSLSVIASCVFAIDPESVKHPNCQFRRMLNKILQPSILAKIRVAAIISFPKLARMLKIKFFDNDVEDFFFTITKDALEIRKSSGIRRNDFVQLLLELKEKGSVQMDTKDLEEDENETIKMTAGTGTTNNELEITDKLLTAQAAVFIIGGFDSTSYLAAITTYLLSKHKDVQTRVREEIKDAISKHGGISYSALKEMKLLDACLNEALRLYPAVFFILRECTKTYLLSNGITIEKGMQLFIPIKAIHQDSKFWTNPEKFYPDRFLNEEVTPGTYLPFGDGPRICIGQRLVLLMVKLVMANMLANFELHPSSKTKEPINVQFLFVTEIVGGLWGTFQPLQD